MKTTNNEKTIPSLKVSKVKTRKEIANEFGVSTTTLWRKLKQEGLILSSGLIYPRDQIRIYKVLKNQL